ncbi:MAG: TonB-dependent receptor [Bacteroidota bacterium]
MRLTCFLLFVLCGHLPVSAQLTTAHIGGTVKSANGEWIVGAVIRLIHQPTGTVYQTRSVNRGSFYIDHIIPGELFSLTVSHMGYRVVLSDSLDIPLENTVPHDFILQPTHAWLDSVTVGAIRNPLTDKIMANRIAGETIRFLPGAGRQLNAYIKLLPLANTTQGGEGISLAGQNNRYNLLYVDGAVNNDAFGLSASGSNGEQAGISSLSIEAVEQLQVSVSPYDASIGNFTGGSIHAITKNGTNQPKTSLYTFRRTGFPSGLNSIGSFRQPTERSYAAVTGISLQGPLVRNRFFYFINAESEQGLYTNQYDFTTYKGNTKNPEIIKLLMHTLRGNYGYAAGDYRIVTNNFYASRMLIRFDWNLNARNRIAFSNRFANGRKTYTNPSDESIIHFSNDGFRLNTVSNTTTLEWKNVTGKKSANKLLLTYSVTHDQRGSIEQDFPRVRINDGDGALIFGTDINATRNVLRQKKWTLLNKFSFLSGRHLFTVGVDAEYVRIQNAFIQNTFGNYTYASMADFLQYKHPSAYRVAWTGADYSGNQPSAGNFSVWRSSFFFNDEIRILPQLLIQVGIRTDKYQFPDAPLTNDFINQTAMPIFSRYWPTAGTRSGESPKIPLSLSPRLGFQLQLNRINLLLLGGAGIFSGKVPLVWPGGVYQHNGQNNNGYAADNRQLQKIFFRSEPGSQWTLAETGGGINQQTVNLIAASFSMPKIMRVSLGFRKKINAEWTLDMNGMLTINLQEIAYTNLNILPPSDTAAGPDQRLIYPVANNAKIPLYPDGSNPYEYVILLRNQAGNKGYSKQITTSLSRQSKQGWFAEISHSFGKSYSLHDGTASVNVSQWRFTERIHGRNYNNLSESDFSAGHKLSMWTGKKFFHGRRKEFVRVSFRYSGQSGQPFSYVYSGLSMTRDDGPYGSYDLVYVPTQEELAAMVFLPNRVDGIVYSVEQQKDALNRYINNNVYLKSRRGNYAERNGSRSPFTHQLDVKFSKEIKMNLGETKWNVQLSLDIANIGNLINKNWGIKYMVPFNQAPVIEFAGYTGTSNPVPQYRADPAGLQKVPWVMDRSGTGPSASFWSCELGLRITSTR